MNRNRTTPTPATHTTPAARAATAALVALAVATGVAAAPSSSAGDMHASRPIPGYGSGVRVGLVTGLVSGV